MQLFTWSVSNMTYRLTRKNGSFPQSLPVEHQTYDQARQSLRRLVRQRFPQAIPRSCHLPLAAMDAMLGLRIAKLEV
jgi:hypothetical protein